MRGVLFWCIATAVASIVAVPVVAAPSSSVRDPYTDAWRRFELPDESAGGGDQAFSLPTLPPQSGRDSPANGLKIFVRKLELEGNTAVPTADIAPILKEFEGRALDSLDIDVLRSRVTELYRSRGFVTSGALVPDQDVNDGVITLKVVEGQLDRIDITHNRVLNAQVYQSRLRQQLAGPLNLGALQEAMHTLLADPLVKRMDVELVPAERAGFANLRARVEEAAPYRLQARFDNGTSPSLGELHTNISAAHLSLTGRGDTLEAEGGFTEGLRSARVAYDLPLAAHRLIVGIAADGSLTDVVEQPLDEINVESEGWGAHVHGAWFFLDNARDTASFDVALDRRRSQTYLLGNPFSFSPGVINGRSDVTALRLRQEWTHRQANHVLGLRSTFSVGLDAMGATVNRVEPDSRFFHWTLQAQFAQRLRWHATLVARCEVQLSADQLLPIEKLALGGMDTVRGYREVDLVRDSGFDASLEYRQRVWSLPDHGMEVQLAPFVDAGRGVDLPPKAAPGTTLASAGVGLRLDAGSRLFARLYWAHPFLGAGAGGDSLQGDGIHFELSTGLP